MGLRLVHLFEELNRLGTTVIIATHSHQLVERLGYAQLKLYDGHLKIIPGRNNRTDVEVRGAKTDYEASDSKKHRPDSLRTEIVDADLSSKLTG